MTPEIPLTQGKTAIVDSDVYAELMQYKWCATRSGTLWYAVRGGGWKKNLIYMHNVIMGCKWVDHINGDGLDNRRQNLRQATSQQNNRNRSSRSGTSSPFKGVSWDKRREKWRARIYSKDRGEIWLGYFDSMVRAGCAYDDAARKLFGEFAKVNFAR